MSIVITGNPGVGKHTIGKKLAKEMNYQILDINKIIKESSLYEKKEGTLDVNIKKIKPIFKKKISKKSIIVGHLAPYIIPKSKIKYAIVLRKNPHKLISIYKKRKYSKKKISDNVGSEILGIIAFETFKKFGKTKTYQIDTTSKSVSKIIKIINSIYKGKKVNENVDWLSLIAKKNELKKFFSY